MPGALLHGTLRCRKRPHAAAPGECIQVYILPTLLRHRPLPRSIAFCTISTGVFGFPNPEACQTALRAVAGWLGVPGNASAMDLVEFCTWLDKDSDLYADNDRRAFPGSAGREQ